MILSVSKNKLSVQRFYGVIMFISILIYWKELILSNLIYWALFQIDYSFDENTFLVLIYVLILGIRVDSTHFVRIRALLCTDTRGLSIKAPL